LIFRYRLFHRNVLFTASKKQARNRLVYRQKFRNEPMLRMKKQSSTKSTKDTKKINICD